MDCKRKPGVRSRIRRFRGITWGLGVCIAGVLVLTWGCSGGEDKAPEGKNKVVVAIKKSVPESVPEKKAEPSPPMPQKPAEPAVVPAKEKSPEQETTGQQAPPAPIAGAQGKETTVAEQAGAPPPKKTEAAKVQNPEVPKMTKPEAPGTEKPEAAKVEKLEAAKVEKPEAAKVEEAQVAKEKKGFIRVEKGESLSAVAAREDVYGDPLKWTRLYRLNLQRLSMIRTGEDVEKKPLPEGISLRYVPPETGKEAQPPLAVKNWVITIRSWQTPERLAAPAIQLLQNGYHAYITRAVVNGKHWLRLRVGFYGSKADALAARKKILEILGNDDSWISRAGESEVEEFRDK